MVNLINVGLNLAIGSLFFVVPWLAWRKMKRSLQTDAEMEAFSERWDKSEKFNQIVEFWKTRPCEEDYSHEDFFMDAEDDWTDTLRDFLDQLLKSTTREEEQP